MGFYLRKHLLSAIDIDFYTLQRILDTARLIQKMEEDERGINVLKKVLNPMGKQKKILVYAGAPSLRTVLGSDDAIEDLLGGRSKVYQGPLSSFDGEVRGPKEESLFAIIRTVEKFKYNGIMIRDDSIRGESYFKILADYCERVKLPISIISMGEGNIEHPLQMLADMCVISEHKPDELRTGQIKLGIMGDVEDSRTARSLVLKIAEFGGAMYFISPPGNTFPDAVWQQALSINKEAIIRKGHPRSILLPDEVYETSRCRLVRVDTDDPFSVIKNLDVLYCIRCQVNLKKNLTPSEITTLKARYQRYWLTEELRNEAPPNIIFHHPLPHWEEFPLELDLDEDPRCKHWDGVAYGRLTKAAVLKEIFNPHFNLLVEWNKIKATAIGRLR